MAIPDTAHALRQNPRPTQAAPATGGGERAGITTVRSYRGGGVMDYGYYGEAHQDKEVEPEPVDSVYTRVIRGICKRAYIEAMKNHGLRVENPYKRADYAAYWDDVFDDVYQNFHKDEIDRREMEYWAEDIPF
jgi:hypothetical protein